MPDRLHIVNHNIPSRGQDIPGMQSDAFAMVCVVVMSMSGTMSTPWEGWIVGDLINRRFSSSWDRIGRSARVVRFGLGNCSTSFQCRGKGE